MFFCLKEDSYKESRGWLEPMIPRYSKDGQTRLEILPQPVDDDSFNHLVLTYIETGTRLRLTYGRVTVTTILGWNQEAELV